MYKRQPLLLPSGNDLSFALTLLDGNNNGICISSIYGRSESRIFSKPIVKGKSLVSLSPVSYTHLDVYKRQPIASTIVVATAGGVPVIVRPSSLQEN